MGKHGKEEPWRSIASASCVLSDAREHLQSSALPGTRSVARKASTGLPALPTVRRLATNAKVFDLATGDIALARHLTGRACNAVQKPDYRVASYGLGQSSFIPAL